jgi:hypothetical protein
VNLIVKRGDKMIVLNADRQPLGIRALAVEAGVALPANPPASARGSFALEWTAADSWYHLGDATGPYGAEHHEFGVARQAGTLIFSTRIVNSAGRVAADATAASIRMTLSDRTASYGVTVDSFTYRDELADVSANCRGGVVKGTMLRRITGVKQEIARPTVPEAICSLALPRLAAALPRKEGIVMPLAVISELDLQTRLGYALETLKEVSVKVTGEQDKAFGVRLWHLGQVEATYYFSPKRELIYAEYEGGVSGVRLLRAADETAAIKAMAAMSATTSAPAGTTVPATAPARVPGDPVRAIDPAAPPRP